jgi:hemerythrin-like domain-containing protein
MMDAVGFWHAEHAQFARLLVIFERQLDRFRAGDEPDYELMRDIVQYLRDYADCFHHPREDAAFEILVARAPQTRESVQRLQQEHHDLAEAGATLLERLRELASDAMMPRGTIEAAATAYLVNYRRHIDAEEREVMPVAGRVLVEADWRRVVEAVQPASDPLFGENPAEVFRELRRHLFLNAAQA